VTDVVPEFAQDPSDRLDYSFDFHDEVARLWLPGTDYALDTIVRPARQLSTGYQYRCTTAGRSGKTYPAFPRTLGSTVKDGSAVWTAEAVTSGSLRKTITNATVPAVTGLTISGEAYTSDAVGLVVAGGTLGQRYLVTCRATFSDGTQADRSFGLTIAEQ
jgi:hypothetical protein